AAHVGRNGSAYRKAADYVVSLGKLPLGRVVNDAKVTDHHAIIPTNAPHEASLTEDERRIYDMAARRFLAAFHPEAVFQNTTVLTEVAGERFRSRGKGLIEAGWRAAYDRLPAGPPIADPSGSTQDPHEQPG